jgi:hypothetical protein
MPQASNGSPNPQNSRSADFTEQIAELVARSPGFARELAELRRIAGKRHPRLGFAMQDRSLAELQRQLDPPAGRPPRTWRRPPVRAIPAELGGGYIEAIGGSYYCDAVRRYLWRLRRVASHYLGQPMDELLAALHEHVRGRPLALPLTGRPALDGARASTVTSYLTGASWHGTPASRRQAWYETRPVRERFRFNLEGASTNSEPNGSNT